MNGAELANRTKQRRELDYYPTPPDVTAALMDFLKERYEFDYVWEPACGEGMMADVIHQWGCTVSATDIRYTGYGIGGLDYLTTKHPYGRGVDAIITNPPFNESEAFIRKALEEDKPFIVAMLVKSQYWHATKRTILFTQHPPAWVLALNWRPDFMDGERGGRSTMECLWTIWVKGDYDTKFRILSRPEPSVGVEVSDLD